jgi:hypothetical protein
VTHILLTAWAKVLLIGLNRRRTTIEYSITDSCRHFVGYDIEGFALCRLGRLHNVIDRNQIVSTPIAGRAQSPAENSPDDLPIYWDAK